MGYNIIYDGIKYGEKGFANLINEKVNTNGMSVSESISAQLKWTVDNCSNINDIFLANTLDYIWYYIKGLHTKRTDAEMERQITELVEKNVINEW